MVVRERSYRGISARAAIGYLESVGGEQTGDRTVSGSNWVAELSEETVSIGPTVKLTEVTVVFESDSAEILEPIIDAFSQKAIRAGG
jgi:hypothetical protein